MIEESLPEILRSAKKGVAGANLMAGGQRFLPPLRELAGKIGPRHIPTIAIARRNLLSDRQALSDIGHAGVGFADAALQLSVKIRIIKEQSHSLLVRQPLIILT